MKFLIRKMCYGENKKEKPCEKAKKIEKNDENINDYNDFFFEIEINSIKEIINLCGQHDGIFIRMANKKEINKYKFYDCVIEIIDHPIIQIEFENDGTQE